MPDIDGDDGAARAHYIRSLLFYMMETRRVQLCKQQKLRDLEIAHQCRTISRLCSDAMQSRDCVNLVHNPKIGMQFLDSEDVQCNLEIAQNRYIMTAVSWYHVARISLWFSIPLQSRVYNCLLWVDARS